VEGKRKKKLSLVLYVPRRCPLVLLVLVRFREGKALGCELCYEQSREFELGYLLRMIGINFYVDVEKKIL
jgi:hypothetical protein